MAIGKKAMFMTLIAATMVTLMLVFFVPSYEPLPQMSRIVTVKTRPMLQFDIKLQAGQNQTQQILEELEKKDITDAIVKIIYHIPEEKTDKVDLLAIQRACVKAMYVVGIIPVHQHVTRQQRAQLKVDLDFSSLLSNSSPYGTASSQLIFLQIEILSCYRN